MAWITNKCKYCKCDYPLNYSTRLIESGRGKFCSVDCKNKAQVNGKKIKCKYCGTKFKIPKHKLKTAKYCSRDCKNKARIGVSPPTEVGRKISAKLKGRTPKNFGITFLYKGKDNCKWKGGITSENDKIRKSKKYKEWRTAVFERDKYTCVWCKKGNKNGERTPLNADHIKPFSHFPKLRFDINNGRTLCVPCHKKTDTYLTLTRWKKYANTKTNGN